MNLAGIAIGNGWIDPLRQYPAYAEFAYEKKLIKKGTEVGASRYSADFRRPQNSMQRWRPATRHWRNLPMTRSRCLSTSTPVMVS